VLVVVDLGSAREETVEIARLTEAENAAQARWLDTEITSPVR